MAMALEALYTVLRLRSRDPVKGDPHPREQRSFLLRRCSAEVSEAATCSRQQVSSLDYTCNCLFPFMLR